VGLLQSAEFVVEEERSGRPQSPRGKTPLIAHADI
jgi:hypothetical protein